MAEKKQADFDYYAQSYRAVHTANIHAVSGADSSYFGEYKVRIIRREEDAEQKVMILDLGCGDGMNAGFFAQYFPRMEYHGLDISKESIRQAAGKLQSENIFFDTYNGKEIPFADHMFDIILIACVLHHVPHAEHAGLLKECRRVLKKRAHMFIFEHNPLNPVTRKIVKDCPFDENAVLLRGKCLKALLKDLGFRKIKLSYTIFFPRRVFFRPMIRIEKYLKRLPLGGQYYIKCEK